MKITKRQLQRIVNEERQKLLSESEFHDFETDDVSPYVIQQATESLLNYALNMMLNGDTDVFMTVKGEIGMTGDETVEAIAQIAQDEGYPYSKIQSFVDDNMGVHE